jgi:hypothetical protein
MPTPDVAIAMPSAGAEQFDSLGKEEESGSAVAADSVAWSQLLTATKTAQTNPSLDTPWNRWIRAREVTSLVHPFDTPSLPPVPSRSGGFAGAGNRSGSAGASAGAGVAGTLALTVPSAREVRRGNSEWSVQYGVRVRLQLTHENSSSSGGASGRGSGGAAQRERERERREKASEDEENEDLLNREEEEATEYDSFVVWRRVKELVSFHSQVCGSPLLVCAVASTH